MSNILAECGIHRLTYIFRVSMLLSMSRMAEPIVLSPDERATISTWAHGRRFPLRLVQRARIIQMAADGILSQHIAQKLSISRPTVQLWRQRFLALRCAGLEQDAPRPGRIPRISARAVRAVVEATLHTTPPAATHWSTRSMVEAQGLSEATIRRIWKRRAPGSLLNLALHAPPRVARLSFTAGIKRPSSI